jgi:hypothetical protein
LQFPLVRSNIFIPFVYLNKIIGAVIAYGPKNKTKKARKARKAAHRKKIAAIKRD